MGATWSTSAFVFGPDVGEVQLQLLEEQALPAVAGDILSVPVGDFLPFLPPLPLAALWSLGLEGVVHVLCSNTDKALSRSHLMFAICSISWMTKLKEALSVME